MRKILTTVAILLLANTGRLAILGGISNDFWLSLGFLLVTYCYVVFYDKFVRLRLLNLALGLVAAFFVGMGIYIMAYGRVNTVTYREDVAIVLGAGLRGYDVSPTLRLRLESALAFHRANPAALLVVSGGYGRNNAISEAEAMARYLIDAGVPAEQILLEDASRSTYQNMTNTQVLLAERFPGGYTAVVITSDFHIFRSVRFARRTNVGVADADASGGGADTLTRRHGNTPPLSLPGNLIRETAAIVKMWVIGR